MPEINELSGVEAEAVSIVTKGANRQVFFLRKRKRPDDAELFDLPSPEGIYKADADWSAAYCVVAAPGELEDPGMSGDQSMLDRWANEDEIRKTAHRFVKRGGLVNLMHKGLDPYGELVESAIALDDFEVDGHTIKKGSWYIAFEPNAHAKAEIEAGNFTGVSLQGTGMRKRVEKKGRFEEQKHPRKGGKFAAKGSVDQGQGTKKPAAGSGQGDPAAHAANTVRTSANILSELGYTGNLSAALKSFQQKHGIKPTGNPDPETMAALRTKSQEHKATAQGKPKVSRERKQRRKKKGVPRAKGGIAKAEPHPLWERLEKKFDPSQARGAHTGRWIKMLGSAARDLLDASKHGEAHDAIKSVEEAHPKATAQKVKKDLVVAAKAAKTPDAGEPSLRAELKDDVKTGEAADALRFLRSKLGAPKDKVRRGRNGINLEGTHNEQRMRRQMRRERPVQRSIARERRRAGLSKGSIWDRLEKNRPLGHGGDNWITRLPKPLQTAFEKSWIHRAATHLVDKGRPTGQAIATAINAAKKGCATGDLNFPGLQSVNAGSKAEMCAAVTLWNSMKAASHASSGKLAKMSKGGEETEEGVAFVFEELSKIEWAEREPA